MTETTQPIERRYTNFDLLDKVDHFEIIQGYHPCDCKHGRHRGYPHMMGSHTFSSADPEFVYENDLTNRYPQTQYDYSDKDHCQVTTQLDYAHWDHPQVKTFLRDIYDPNVKDSIQSHTFPTPALKPSVDVQRSTVEFPGFDLRSEYEKCIIRVFEPGHVDIIRNFFVSDNECPPLGTNYEKIVGYTYEEDERFQTITVTRVSSVEDIIEELKDYYNRFYAREQIQYINERNKRITELLRNAIEPEFPGFDLMDEYEKCLIKVYEPDHVRIHRQFVVFEKTCPPLGKYEKIVGNTYEENEDDQTIIVTRVSSVEDFIEELKHYKNQTYAREQIQYLNDRNRQITELYYNELDSAQLSSSLIIKRHVHLHNLLNLPKDDDGIMEYIYALVISLCDPYTQPEDNDNITFSVDYLADLLIALTYQKISKISYCLEVNSLKFEMSTYYFKIIQAIHGVLKADDELILKTYLSGNLQQNVDDWTSGIPNQFNNVLLYSVTCVLIYSIYKLFAAPGSSGATAAENYNLALNPYLHYFIKLWKIHTNIILLGLGLDRYLENKTQQEKISYQTPIQVKYTLKGSSSIRYVLAWILNQNPSTLYNHNLLIFDLDYDLKHDNLYNFINPVCRKTINGGALLLDMRLVIIALLISDCGTLQITPAKRLSYSGQHENERRLQVLDPVTALGDLLTDLEYDDRFDEDIQYIFDYELDSETEWLDVDQEDEKEFDKNNDDATTIEFDEAGRDWREVPRGDNVTHQLWYQKSFQNENLDDFIFQNWDKMEQQLLKLTISSIQGDESSADLIGQKLINTIDYAQDGANQTITSTKIFDFFRALASEEATEATQSNNKQIVPIYNITNFELILHNNGKLARCMMDEMFMCRGFRRNIIWFLTHNVNLSILLIDYIFELLLGKRGENQETGYLFTRKGNLVLSEVEQLMLLHEFLINCNTYLSATEGIQIDDGYKVYLAESIAMKFMTLLCLMIERLISEGIIDLTPRIINENDNDIQDYRTELQILLIHWVGKIPEARALFFKVKNSITESIKEEKLENVDESIMDEKTKRITSESIKKVQANLFEKYRTMTSLEISQDLKVNSIHNTIIEFFTLRIELHINYIISNNPETIHQTLSSVQLTQLCTDFNIFFENFNTLCKIEYIAETLFNKFEHHISGDSDQPEQPQDQNEHHVEPDTFDSEFNNQFLDGQVFPEDKGSTKKKKKKKKLKKR